MDPRYNVNQAREEKFIWGQKSPSCSKTVHTTSALPAVIRLNHQVAGKQCWPGAGNITTAAGARTISPCGERTLPIER